MVKKYHMNASVWQLEQVFQKMEGHKLIQPVKNSKSKKATGGVSCVVSNFFESFGIPCKKRPGIFYNDFIKYKNARKDYLGFLSIRLPDDGLLNDVLGKKGDSDLVKMSYVDDLVDEFLTTIYPGGAPQSVDNLFTKVSQKRLLAFINCKNIPKGLKNGATLEEFADKFRPFVQHTNRLQRVEFEKFVAKYGEHTLVKKPSQEKNNAIRVSYEYPQIEDKLPIADLFISATPEAMESDPILGKIFGYMAENRFFPKVFTPEEVSLYGITTQQNRRYIWYLVPKNRYQEICKTIEGFKANKDIFTLGFSSEESKDDQARDALKVNKA